MPKPIFHLWIARELSAQNPSLCAPDFFLGHIAPDAALSRKDPPLNFKNTTHLTASTDDKTRWTQSVVNYYASLVAPTLFDLGYCMHVVTDIEFRKFMRSYYDQYNIPAADRDSRDSVIMPLLFQQLFSSEAEYVERVRFAQKSALTEFPFTITHEEMDDNIRFAESSYPSAKITPPDDLPVPDAHSIGMDIINTLLTTFSY